LGILYIVATPVGNLEDITLRALRVLREADAIVCEDTRQTQKLLGHYSIDKPLISYHEHNEAARTPSLIARLVAGESLALVTDAGTPLISDPGYRIVRAAAAAGVSVVPIPGASAAILALSASGLPTDQFRFCGFLPPRSGQRRHILESLRSEEATLIFYEAPHRILEALDDVQATLGFRETVVARELTKVHEEFLRGTPAELREILAARPSVKGEITLLISKAGEPLVPEESLEEAVARLETAGVARMDAIKQAARERGLSKREAYSRLQK
jgi:16S rRNA (cytidine1402-2'-O)-methyltransferase